MIAFILALFLSTIPSIATAAGLVPCDGPDCSVCNITDLMDNVIRWFIGFGSVLAIIIISYAGIKLVTSGGSQSAVEHAKSMAFDVVLGFIILLCAYLIVNVFMTSLTGKSLSGWKIKCVAPPSISLNIGAPHSA